MCYYWHVYRVLPKHEWPRMLWVRKISWFMWSCRSELTLIIYWFKLKERLLCKSFTVIESQEKRRISRKSFIFVLFWLCAWKTPIFYAKIATFCKADFGAKIQIKAACFAHKVSILDWLTILYFKLLSFDRNLFRLFLKTSFVCKQWCRANGRFLSSAQLFQVCYSTILFQHQ